MGRLIKKICKNCNKEFFVEYRMREQKFCCKHCANENKKSKKEYILHCKKCKKEYKIYVTENIFNSGDYTKYCSRSCSNSRILNDETKNKIRDSLLKSYYKNKFYLKNIDENLQNNILEFRNNKLTYKEIYEKINRKTTKENIRLLCNKNGLSYLDRLNDEDIDVIKNSYSELKNIKKVSKKTGYSINTIRKYITIPNKKTQEEIKHSKSENVINWRIRIKKKLVEYKGGKCCVCGYNKSTKALEFHHIDPKEKDFTISGKSWSFEKLKKESDKCILVCANCHIEMHENENENKEYLQQTKKT